MTTGITTYGDVSPRTAAYAAKQMLKHAGPVTVLEKFGATKEMPKNMTDTMKFRRVTPFSAADIPLVEGVTPTAQKMAYVDVSVQLKQYGRHIVITDVIEDTHEDPVLMNASEQCGEQAARTLEAIIYGVVKAGTSVSYTNGSARNAVNTAVSLNKQRGVTRYLKNQKAMKFTKVLDGSPNYQTKPIEAAYIGIGHTDVEADLRGLSGFVPVAQYGSRQPVSEYEIGSVEDVRYVLSPDLSSWADAGGAKGSMYSTSGTYADVYPILYFGQEAYATVPLKGTPKAGSSITPMVLRPGIPRGGDELGQRGSVGWKAWMQACILNQSWMKRLETAVTDL